MTKIDRTRSRAIVEPGDMFVADYIDECEPHLMLQTVSTRDTTEDEMKRRERLFISTTFNLK